MTELPQTGDIYTCDCCGMTLEIQQGCQCAEDDLDAVLFRCCGSPMRKMEDHT